MSKKLTDNHDQTTTCMAEMREIWARFLATNPGPGYMPWDEMSEVDREALRQHAEAGPGVGR